MKKVVLHPDGRVEGGDETFILPATIAGMQERMTVLKEEIEEIRDQLQDKDVYARFEQERDYRKWKRKATMALGWKRTELAWLVDKWQQATQAAKEKKDGGRARYAQVEDDREAARAKRQAIIARWKEEHEDDDFLFLVFELYMIVTSIDGDDCPFTEDELQVIRTARSLLKEHGMPNNYRG